jgi:hypothetical protein
MSLLELYIQLEGAGTYYEKICDEFAAKFQKLLSNSVADVVDYPIVRWDYAYQVVKITISTNVKYSKDLERDLDSIKCVKSYDIIEDSNGLWQDYIIVLDYYVLLKHEMEGKI